ncbi:BrxA family protein [Desulfotruncus alcoholivorax]|uniref:BrxA family protein n=1 Tax=Desulfotruncus alcoholivorax TaxID=265477 RepID=UPI00042A0828
MENIPNYSTTLKYMPFLFLEVKKAASLKVQGLGYSEIVSRSIKDNIFQVNTESRKKEIAAAVIKRLSWI